MAIKTKSKYIPQDKINNAYSKLEGVDELVFRIYHRTAIRLGELEDYVKLAERTYLQYSATLGNRFVDLTPQKKNNKRLLPLVLTEEEVKQLFTISLNKKAIEARIAKWKLGFSAHDLRATFITNGLEKDINPVKMMNLTGHKELSSLLKYSRLTTEHSLWMYEYITADYAEWRKSDDIDFLKKQLDFYEKEYNKVRQRMVVQTNRFKLFGRKK